MPAGWGSAAAPVAEAPPEEQYIPPPEEQYVAEAAPPPSDGGYLPVPGGGGEAAPVEPAPQEAAPADGGYMPVPQGQATYQTDASTGGGDYAPTGGPDPATTAPTEGPPPAQGPGLLQGVTDALGGVGNAIYEVLPEPARNVADAIGQPVGGISDTAARVGTELSQGDVAGAVGAGLGGYSGPWERGVEQAGDRIMAGEPAVPTLDEIIADPGQALAIPAGIASRYGPAPAISGVTEEAWVAANPEEAQAAYDQGGSLGLRDAWLASTGASDVPPEQLSNPFDAATSSNPLERLGQVAGALPEFASGWVESGKQGTLGPFVLGQAQSMAEDPLTILDPVIGKALHPAVGAAGRTIRNAPVINKITAPSAGAIADIEAERLQAQGVERITSTQRQMEGAAIEEPGAVANTGSLTPEQPLTGTSADWGVPPPPTNGRTTPTTGVAPPPTNGRVAPPTAPTPNGNGVAPTAPIKEGSAAGLSIRPLDDGYAVFDGPEPYSTGHQTIDAARRDMRNLYNRRNLLPDVEAPLSGVNLTKDANTVSLANSLRRQLSAAGLDDYGLVIYNKLTSDNLNDVFPNHDLSRLEKGTEIGGFHERSLKMIGLALEHADNANLGQATRMGLHLDHEVVHALRSLDLFRPDEWDTLLRLADEVNVQGQMDPKVYGSLAGEDLAGEKVAQLYELWRTGVVTTPDATGVRLLERIKTFLQSLGVALRETYPNANKILNDIHSGEIGRRPRVVGALEAPPPSAAPTRHPIGDSAWSDTRSPEGEWTWRTPDDGPYVAPGTWVRRFGASGFEPKPATPPWDIPESAYSLGAGTAPNFAAVNRGPSLQLGLEDKLSEPPRAMGSTPAKNGDPRWGMRALLDGSVDLTQPVVPPLTIADDVLNTQLKDIRAKVAPRSKETLAGIKGFRGIDAATLKAALSIPAKDMLWFEDQARTVANSLKLPTKELNEAINAIGATSAGATPDVNFGRGISAMAEHSQGKPILTPVQQGAQLAEAFRSTHLSSPKFAEYANTFKYHLGLIDTPPGMVIDRHVLSALGLPQNFNLTPDRYTALSDYLVQVRDMVNEGLPVGQPPLENWHLQSGLWHTQRGNIGTSFADYLAAKLPELQARGVPLGPNGEIILDTLMHPETITTFGQTADFAATMPWGTVSPATSRAIPVRNAQAMLSQAPISLVRDYDAVVQQPLRTALRNTVLPTLMKALAGTQFQGRAIQPGVRATGNQLAESFVVPFGGQAAGSTRWRPGDLNAPAAALAHAFNLDEVRITSLDDGWLGAGEMTSDALRVNNQSATYTVHVPNSRMNSGDAAAALSQATGIPVEAEVLRAGGMRFRFDTEPGQIVNGRAVEQAVHQVFPDTTAVEMRSVIQTTHVGTPEDWAAARERIRYGATNDLRTGSPTQRDRAAKQLDALNAFDEAAGTANREFERRNARWVKDHEADIPNAAPADAAYTARAVNNQRLQFAARSAYNGTPDGFQSLHEERIRNTADPTQFRGGYESAEFVRQLQEPIGTRLKFRDESGSPKKRDMSVADAADTLFAEVQEWVQGHDTNGTPIRWTEKSKRWKGLDARFRPMLEETGTDIKSMLMGPGNPEAHIPSSRARADFASQVWNDAVMRAMPSRAAKTKLGRAFGTYMNSMRGMMLYNVLNLPRYVTQNMVGNSINVARRGGGPKVVLDTWTNLPEWARTLGNQRDPTSLTTLDAQLKRMGVGDRPNIKQNQRRYYDKINRGGDSPKVLRAIENGIAPPVARWIGGAADQIFREHVGSNAINDGFRQLNAQMPKRVTEALRKNIKSGTMVPGAKIQQVIDAFMNDMRTLDDPNVSGKKMTGLFGKTSKFEPTWAADDLANYLKEHLLEDMPAGSVDRTSFNAAIEQIRRSTKPDIRAIADNASKTVDDALFSWRNTVGDEWVAKGFLFHYWASRQGGFYVSEMIKHPWVAAAYGRMMEDMQQQNEALGGPAWMTGWFQFMQTPAGLSVWTSPFDIVGSLLTMADWQKGQDDEGFKELTPLGKVFRAMPLMIQPAIEFVAYELGLLGPDYPAPRPTGTETFSAKTIELLNLANAQDAPFMKIFNAMGVGVDAEGNKIPLAPRPLEDLYESVGNGISTALAPLTGIAPVEVVPSWAGMDTNIAYFGEQETRRLHPEWDEFQVLQHRDAVLADPGSAEYRDWYRRAAELPYAGAGKDINLQSALGRIASPFGIRAVPEQRQLDSMEGLNPTGNAPMRGPSPDKTVDPLGADVWNNLRYGATSTVEGRALNLQKTEFDNLLPPSLIAARKQSTAISNCNLEEGCYLDGPITVGDTTYQPSDIQNMSNWDRKQVKQQYLSEAGFTEEEVYASYDTETQYLLEHPEYAQYEQYKDLVAAAEPVLGPDGKELKSKEQVFAEQMAAVNPAFAQYLRSSMTDQTTGEVKYSKVWNPDAYLVAQGKHPSVYTPVAGDEPTTAPGGYPAIPGGPAGQPLIPTEVYVIADTPLYENYWEAEDGDVEPHIVSPEFSQKMPLKVIDPNAPGGQWLVNAGGITGYVDPALLENATPAAPAAAPTPGPAQPSGNGGLAGAVGGVMNALGAGKDALGAVVGSMLGAPGQESKPAATSAGVAPGAYDVVPAVDGIGEQSTKDGSDRTWMEFMYDNNARVTTEYKGPPTSDMSYQLGHGATAGNHAAYDIGCETGECYGTAIKSPVSGKVVCAGEAGTGGALGSPQCTYAKNTTLNNRDGTPAAHDVVIEVGTDSAGNPIQMSFSHLGTTNLQPGQTVNVGDQIGTVGDTTGGPHTHVEGWVGDPTNGYNLVDPQLVVSGYYGPVDSVAVQGETPAPAPSGGGIGTPTLDWLGGLTGRYDDPNGTTPFTAPAAAPAATGSAAPQTPAEYQPLVQEAAAAEGVPPEILSALLQQESQYDPSAVSPAGAQGIAQFMPATAAGMGIDPLDPNQAIPAAAEYLRQQYDTFGSWELALAAYNAGAGNVQQYGGIPPFAETQHYVTTIMSNAGYA
jgi:murein DD-endopeptidase MepM/ murein hydrolase activator NlpD